MKNFNTFYFERFEFDKISLKAKFFYSFDKTEHFEEVIDFSSDFFNIIDSIDYEIINNILFHLHIALWISYYKLFPTEQLILESGFLDEKQIEFWISFYLNWLWEFFIKNNFDFKKILNFENIKNFENKGYKNVEINGDNSLLMWWGWKDSIVSSILLNEEKKDYTPFVFWKIDRIKEDTLKVLWKKVMLVKRTLSSNLFKLNKEWYYNWHVPITGIIAFVSIVSSYLYNFKNIVLSNEKSANEENTIWNGLKINHQYSKSGEFEKYFRSYVENNISKNINYYSKLRDRYEIEIAEIFAKEWYRFFENFSSCNRNFVIFWDKQKLNWCCDCEKCAFVYLILSPFLDEGKMLSIFKQNLLNNKSLLNIYKGLFWFTENKPFECVWTYDESLLSAYKTLNNYKTKIESWEIKKLPYILENLENKIINYEKKDT